MTIPNELTESHYCGTKELFSKNPFKIKSFFPTPPEQRSRIKDVTDCTFNFPIL
jgi:hypothetical protein